MASRYSTIRLHERHIDLEDEVERGGFWSSLEVGVTLLGTGTPNGHHSLNLARYVSLRTMLEVNWMLAEEALDVLSIFFGCGSAARHGIDGFFGKIVFVVIIFFAVKRQMRPQLSQSRD